MATLEIATTKQIRKALASSATETYGRALAILTTLFFMWGFITCLNDILVPHLKSIFDLNYTNVMQLEPEVQTVGRTSRKGAKETRLRIERIRSKNPPPISREAPQESDAGCQHFRKPRVADTMRSHSISFPSA